MGRPCTGRTATAAAAADWGVAAVVAAGAAVTAEMAEEVAARGWEVAAMEASAVAEWRAMTVAGTVRVADSEPVRTAHLATMAAFWEAVAWAAVEARAGRAVARLATGSGSTEARGVGRGR